MIRMICVCKKVRARTSDPYWTASKTQGVTASRTHSWPTVNKMHTTCLRIKHGHDWFRLMCIHYYSVGPKGLIILVVCKENTKLSLAAQPKEPQYCLPYHWRTNIHLIGHKRNARRWICTSPTLHGHGFWYIVLDPGARRFACRPNAARNSGIQLFALCWEVYANCTVVSTSQAQMQGHACAHGLILRCATRLRTETYHAFSTCCPITDHCLSITLNIVCSPSGVWSQV